MDQLKELLIKRLVEYEQLIKDAKKDVEMAKEPNSRFDLKGMEWGLTFFEGCESATKRILKEL